jgi:hypothetical protein
MPGKHPADTHPSDSGSPESVSVNPYSEEETARRRAAANRRTRNAAATADSGRPAKRPGRAGPEKYRGIEYSVAPHGDGQWIWKVRAAGDRGAPSPSGTVRGRQNDAIEAAHRAIDKALGTQRK